MKKVLITGSKGFIGRKLYQSLIDQDYQVITHSHQDGSIENENTWNNLEKAEIVIHLAAKSFVPDSWNDISSFFNTNIIGTTEALKYCQKNQSKLIFLSTYMYGNPETLPITELHKIYATNPYTLSKKIAEDICFFYNQNFGIDVTILRPFNVFGFGQSQNFIIPKIIKEIKENKIVKLSDLTPKRDFIYIDDLINAISLSIKNINGFQIYNVGSGVSISIGDLCKLIFKICNIDYNVISDHKIRQGEILDCYADISKITNNLGWTPQWSLESGLTNYIKLMGNI